MRTKKVTVLLFLTVISLLTMFLVVLLDDTALAAENSDHRMLQNLNLSAMLSGSMVVMNHPQRGAHFLRAELNSWKWCDDASV